MDAAVLGFPGRLIGVTGLKYTIDLTNVKIAPPYEGTDKTYAFIGFYAWQDYYVIANGIACDTSTGNWYQFIGTSRDDSFSDVTYNIGACVMTSTYNETGGYFVPDNPSLTMEIKTTQQYDSQFDEYYQLDKLKISIENGATFERDISDSTVNNFFPGYPLGYENSYAFIAGLDIKNNTVQSQYTEATDYFNGSFFTGLTVTDAQAYVPTSEEISDVVYGYAINEEWRGKWHDILLSNTEDTPDLYDYTVLNTCVCSSYTALNGHDVYDFSYTGNPVGNAKLGVEARQYQTKIDSLDQMSVEDLLADSSVLDEVATWIAEGSTVVTQRIRLVLDFAPYYRAKEKLENYNVTEEAKAVIEAIRAIEICTYYHQHPDLKLATEPHPLTDAVVIGVSIDREARRRRITERLDARLQAGMVDEVQRLIEGGVDPDDLIYYGLEYKFVTRYVIGELSWQQMHDQLEIAIHQFAKRQMTWFRGMERRGTPIHWLPYDMPSDEFNEAVMKLLQ